MSRQLAFAAALLAAALSDGDVAAEAAGTPPQVSVALAAADGDADAVERIVTDLLGELPVGLELRRVGAFTPGEVIRRPAAPSATLAEIWIDLRSAGEGVLYIVDGRLDRVLVRHVRRAGSDDVVALESAGQILRAAVETLLAGEAVGVPRASAAAVFGVYDGTGAPPVVDGSPGPARSGDGASPEGAEGEPSEGDRTGASVEAPPPPTSLGPRTGLDMGVGYGVEVWSPTIAPLHGPSGWVSLSASGVPLRPGMILSGTYRIPAEVDDGEVGARLAQGSLSLAVRVEAYRSRALSLHVAAGGRLDIVHVEPRLVGNDDTLVPQGSRSLVAGGLTGLVELHLRLVGRLLLRVAAGVVADVSHAAYTVERGGAEALVFDPWWVRPTLSVGLGGDLL